MITEIIGLHLEITEPLKKKVQEQINKMKNILEKADTLKVELSTTKSLTLKINTCHIILTVNNKTIDIKKENKDMYDCISLTFKTLKNSILKNKAKKHTTKKKKSLKTENIKLMNEQDKKDSEEYHDEAIEEEDSFNRGEIQYPD